MRAVEKTWNFLKEFAWPFGLCGGVYAIASRFIPLDHVTNTLGLLALVVVLFALVICLSGYVIRGGPPASYPEIKVEQVRDSGRLFISKKSPALGVNMAAMVYFKDGSYERLVGLGTVSHVQTDGLTQIAVEYVPGVESDVRIKISENSRDVISNLFVRPGVNIQSVVPVEVGE